MQLLILYLLFVFFWWSGLAESDLV